MMADHVCVIGLLHHCDYSELTTIAHLKDHIAERVEENCQLKEFGLEKCIWLHKKEWSLQDYCDRRRHTNLYRFNHCPECGKEIDWKRIRREENAAD